jgi:hypothetical protein
VTTSILDDPIALWDDDLLGRAAFARELIALLKGAPADASFRVGIYGEWGEGKTSVMRLMETHAVAEGMRTTWVYPWTLLTALELRADVIHKVARALDIRGKLRATTAWFDKRLSSAREIAGGLDWKVKVANAAFGPPIQAVVGRVGKRATAAMIKAIETRLIDQTLIVFVDDLNRIRPELLMDFLLTLRDALPFPHLFFVIGASPGIIAEGLRSQHPGFDEPRRFLEKIIEYPTYLPTPSQDTLNRFLSNHIEGLGGQIELSALEANAALLPTNPRSLKLLLRLLAALSAKLRRFAPDEIDIPQLYLLQGLRGEFPDIAAALAEDRAALGALQYGGAQRGDESDSLPEPLLGHAPPEKDALRRKRYTAYCQSVIARSFTGFYGPQTLLRFVEFEPILTRQEMNHLYEACRGSDTEQASTVIDSWIKSRIDDPTAVRVLFSRAVELRARLWDQVVESRTEDATVEHLAEVPHATRILEVLLSRCGAVRDGLVGPDEWAELYGHLRLYSAWREPAEYLQTREDDLRLLELSVTDAPEDLWVGILSAVDRGGFDGSNGVGEQFVERSKDIYLRAARVVVQMIFRRFEAPNGIAAMLGSESHTEADLAFDPDGVFHSPASRARLEALARRAAEEPIVHDNMLRYWRALVEGAFGSRVALSSMSCRQLLKDQELVRLVWSGAVARGLNRRVVGTLLEQRTLVVKESPLVADSFPTTAAFDRMAATLVAPPKPREGGESAGTE